MPYKLQQSQALQKRRYRLLQDLRKIDNFALMNCIAAISPEHPEVLVRVVGIDFKETCPKAVSKYTAHLSVLATQDIEKYLEMLKAMGFPYSVDFGHFYRIKQVSSRKVRAYRDKRQGSLNNLADGLLDLRRKRVKQRLMEPLRIEESK